VPEPLLSVRGVVAGYGDVTVLRGVDLDIEEGAIVALLGANGAGKTTLNKTLSGLLTPVRGDIRFGGERLVRRPPAAIVAAGLIHVPEGRRLYPDMTVRENLELGSYRRGRRERARTLERVLATFPRLAGRLSQRAATLSGGEQQMVAIGRGLMGQPRLLVLDEPSLGLAPLLVDEMFALTKHLNQEGVTILLVEQNAVQSLAIADLAHVMEEGVIALSGQPSELAGDAALARMYLGM
jgi:branched-chain amino acid transport system ATP-binding protein